MNPDASIDATNISVLFPLYHGNARSLKKLLVSAASGRLGEDPQHRVVVRALTGISFHVGRGERLGLVGSNGAGKTTLLRVLAGIYEPVEGQVRVRGSLTAMLDPGVGMNSELTGRENIMLRGLYNGLNKTELAWLEEDVISFAELSDFIDLPVRIYSAGMTVRLGFAMATAVRPKILLMDEWFLAGDAGFLDKARARLEEMVRAADILVLSTHDNAIVREWCTRVLWLEKGQIRADGPVQDIMDQYAGPVHAHAALGSAEVTG